MEKVKRRYKKREYRPLEELVKDLILPSDREYRCIGKRENGDRTVELIYVDNEGFIHEVKVKMRGKVKFLLLYWDYYKESEHEAVHC